MKLSLPEVYKIFRRYFNGLSFNDFLEVRLSLATQEVKIDIWKFDTWLHKEHGPYELEGRSMKDVLESEYGEGATAFIETLL